MDADLIDADLAESPSVAVPRLGDDVVGWSAIGVAGVGLSSLVLSHGLHLGPANCLLRTAMGVPCPVCGMTTVAVRLVHFDPIGALRLDPVGVVLLVIIAVLALWQTVRLTGRSVPRLSWPWVWVAPLLALAAHWALTLSGVVTLAPLR